MTTGHLFDPAPNPGISLACDSSVFDDPEHHRRSSETLHAEREEMRKVPSGISLCYPVTMSYVQCLLGIIGRERQCCPFLTFEITFEPEGRGLWLYLGGDERVDYLTDHLEARTA